MGPLDAKINETSSTGDSLDEDLTTTDIPMAETTIASDAMQMLEGIDYKQGMHYVTYVKCKRRSKEVYIEHVGCFFLFNNKIMK